MLKTRPPIIKNCLNCKHPAQSHGDEISVASRFYVNRYPEDYRGCRQCDCRLHHFDVINSPAVGVSLTKTTGINRRNKRMIRRTVRNRSISDVKLDDGLKLL